VNKKKNRQILKLYTNLYNLSDPYQIVCTMDMMMVATTNKTSIHKLLEVLFEKKTKNYKLASLDSTLELARAYGPQQIGTAVMLKRMTRLHVDKEQNSRSSNQEYFRQTKASKKELSKLKTEEHQDVLRYLKKLKSKKSARQHVMVMTMNRQLINELFKDYPNIPCISFHNKQLAFEKSPSLTKKKKKTQKKSTTKFNSMSKLEKDLLDQLKNPEREKEEKIKKLKEMEIPEEEAYVLSESDDDDLQKPGVAHERPQNDDLENNKPAKRIKL